MSPPRAGFLLAMPDVTTTRTKSEILEEVFAKIAGGASVDSVFARSPSPDQPTSDLPTDRTFWRWVANDDAVRAGYCAAIKARGYKHAEEIFRIADDLAGKVLAPEEVAAARLRVDVRKWNAARMLPKLYGDRTILSNDPDNPIPPLVVIGPHGTSEG